MMWVNSVILGILFSVLSSITLLYVSMSTGLGPWIGPTLMLLGSLLRASRPTTVAGQIIGSVGGIVATAVGFALPTLYFLDSHLFEQLFSSPVTSIVTIVGITLFAGGFGSLLASSIDKELTHSSHYSFPVTVATDKAAQSKTHSTQTHQLSIGVLISWCICLARDGIYRLSPLLAKRYLLFSSALGNIVTIEIAPLYWSIGFLAGTTIVMPLLFGMISKYAVIAPLLHFFPAISKLDFTMAFCSGIVLSQTIFGMRHYPRMLLSFLSARKASTPKNNLRNKLAHIYLPYAVCMLLGATIMQTQSLTSLSIVQLLLLLLFATIAVYQLVIFSIKTGLAPFGRFMTFVMIPMALIFTLTPVHITYICLFVGIAGACAAILLFNQKLAQNHGLQRSEVFVLHLIGIICAACIIGGAFWLLVTQFTLGGEQLIAHRGRSRALLLTSFHMDFHILILGAIYGFIISRLRINPMLAFGGLIMPNGITIGLSLGAALSTLSTHAATYHPLCSGIFAGETLWIMASVIISLLCKHFI